MLYWERDIYLKLVIDYQERKKQASMQKLHGIDFQPL